MTQARRAVIETQKVSPPSDSPRRGGTTDTSLTLLGDMPSDFPVLGCYCLAEEWS